MAVSVTGTKTITTAPYPTLDATTLTAIFAKSPEQLTVAEFRKIEHALKHVSGGGDPTRTLGSLFV